MRSAIRKTRSPDLDFTRDAVLRIESGETLGTLASALTVRREILYRWRDARRLGGPEALRLRGQPSKSDAVVRSG